MSIQKIKMKSGRLIGGQALTQIPFMLKTTIKVWIIFLLLPMQLKMPDFSYRATAATSAGGAY